MPGVVPAMRAVRRWETQGVEGDKDCFVELGAFWAVGEGPGGFREIEPAGLAENALKSSIFEIFAGKNSPFGSLSWHDGNADRARLARPLGDTFSQWGRGVKWQGERVQPCGAVYMSLPQATLRSLASTLSVPKS